MTEVEGNKHHKEEWNITNITDNAGGGRFQDSHWLVNDQFK